MITYEKKKNGSCGKEDLMYLYILVLSYLIVLCTMAQIFIPSECSIPGPVVSMYFQKRINPGSVGHGLR